MVKPAVQVHAQHAAGSRRPRRSIKGRSEGQMPKSNQIGADTPILVKPKRALAQILFKAPLNRLR